MCCRHKHNVHGNKCAITEVQLSCVSVCVVGHSGGSSGSGSLLHSGVQSGGFKHSDSPVSQWPADIWCESGQQTALPGGGAGRRDWKVQPRGEGHCMCFNAGQWLRTLYMSNSALILKFAYHEYYNRLVALFSDFPSLQHPNTYWCHDSRCGGQTSVELHITETSTHSAAEVPVSNVQQLDPTCSNNLKLLFYTHYPL